jgi:hypothetical protein
MPDEPDPPRKFYGFKPREFERANPISQRAPEPASPSAPDPGIVPTHTGPIDVHELNRIAATGRSHVSSSPSPNRENEIHTILRDNLAVANAAGLNRVAPVRKYRRRKRDFIILMIGGNGFIATVYSFELLLGFQVQCMAARMPMEFYNLVRYAFSNPIVYILPFICMAFFSSAVAWLLFGVLDDY